MKKLIFGVSLRQNLIIKTFYTSSYKFTTEKYQRRDYVMQLKTRMIWTLSTAFLRVNAFYFTLHFINAKNKNC